MRMSHTKKKKNLSAWKYSNLSKVSLAMLNLMPSLMDMHLQLYESEWVGVHAWLQHSLYATHQNRLLIRPFYFIVMGNARERHRVS